MKVIDITKTTDAKESVKLLKSQANNRQADTNNDIAAQIKEYIKQYNPKSHKIFDKREYPDRSIKDNDGQDITQKINRIGIPLQKVIVKKGASFLFGTPVDLSCETGTNKSFQQLLNAIKQIWTDNKLDSVNRQLARQLASATQVAECWYPIKTEKSNRYGFDSDIRMRMQVFSPMRGDFLYPFYNDFGDMIAFCREYNRNILVDGKAKKVLHFDVYTDEETVIFQEINGNWQLATLSTTQEGVEIKSSPNTTGKIPIIFAEQEAVDWDDVQSIIERLEYLMSKFAETNDYHSSPKLVITNGTIKNFAKKGESNSIFELETDGGTEKPEMKYLSWDHATDAVKLEIETLLKFAYTFTQTPDLSFDSVKGINAISGVALQMLLTDAHLKVQEKREIFDAYLERRVRLLLNYLGIMNTSLKDSVKEINISPTIVPFSITDATEWLSNLMTATAGKAILSRRTAVAKAGLVDDVEKELTQIDEDERKSREVSLTEPTTI
ncbi:phage portal protein [Fibrella forsythiae]|uniref:Phage portal protein n=1 Tax=Fibrella forsythiae TaxID=2817061 RepID=A0ABS3JBD5_9BACT|nr:phage portal protein [Fibrella forsythiae]MBO0947302.1 phage portal protein [Fibrella forsythiae]